MTTENEQLFFFFFFFFFWFPTFGRNLIYFSVFCCRRRSLDWRVFFYDGRENGGTISGAQ